MNRALIKNLLYAILPILVVFVVINTLIITQVLVLSKLVFVIISIFLFLLFVGFVYFMLLTFSNSINTVKKKMENLSVGDLSIDLENEDNICLMVKPLAKLLSSIANNFSMISLHIQRIINGEYESEYKSHGSDDILGNDLVELKKNLRNKDLELKKTKDEEERQSWISTGLAKFGDILRQERNNINSMGYDIISNLLDYVDFNQGALYVLNEDNVDDLFYESIASVAYKRQKTIDKQFKIGQGLIGRCAHERLSIYMTEVPNDYLNITSGLGEANPRNLLLVPCKLDDKVFGIIEVASFNLIEKYQIEFVEKLGEIISSTISTVKNSQKTDSLLIASKSQSEELAAQEEELRQNLEEMETTQDDLKRQMEENAKMKKEWEFEKFLFDSLLDKIPSRIFFKDRQSRFIKASRSLADKFGKSNYKELVGLSDSDLLGAEFSRKTMADEQQIMENMDGRFNFEEHEVNSKGEDMWKTVSKIPLIDDDKKCVGIFGIINDITEYKKNEIELIEYKKAKQL